MNRQPNPAFWNRIAEKYAAKPVEDMPAYEAKLARLRELLSPTDRVLEIGCGTGSTAIALAPVVKQWVGADYSTELLRIASAKPAPDNVGFVLATADADIEGAPFDAVCAFSLLHLVPDIEATLHAVRRQLKPGGQFISKTVCVGERGMLFRIFARLMQIVLRVPVLHLLTQERLQDMIAAAGFDIVETGYFSKKSMSPFIVARARGAGQSGAAVHS